MSKARNIKDLLGLPPQEPISYDGYSGLVYVRVSTKRQEVEGTGLTSQETRCKKDLASINVPFELTFPDSLSGGGDFMNRPAMKKLLDYIDARPHKKYVVVFDDLKRFARDTEFHIKLRAAFRARGVILRCLNYTFDETFEGRFVEVVLAGQAELERHQNRRQVVQKMKARLEAGYWAFGRKRGYKQVYYVEHGKLSEPIKEGWEVLKPALEDFAKGVLVRKVEVARRLVEQGFWKVQKPEKYIDKVDKILRDPFYAGLIEYPEWEVARRKGKHKGLISLETFELIQKRLNKIDYNTRIRVDTSPDFPLRGLIICDDCKGHITASWTKGRNGLHPYYQCHTKGCPSYGKVMQRKTVEGKFNEVLQKHTLKSNVEKLVQRMFDKAWKVEVAEMQSREAKVLATKKDLERKVFDLTEMIRAAQKSTIKSVYEKQIELAAEELEGLGNMRLVSQLDLNIPYRTALAKAIGLLKNPYIIWKDLNVTEQHQLYYFIFEAKLPYNRLEGYRTAETPLAKSLFEEFAGQKPLMVEMAGVKPASKTNFSKPYSQD